MTQMLPSHKRNHLCNIIPHWQVIRGGLQTCTASWSFRKYHSMVSTYNCCAHVVCFKHLSNTECFFYVQNGHICNWIMLSAVIRQCLCSVDFLGGELRGHHGMSLKLLKGTALNEMLPTTKPAPLLVLLQDKCPPSILLPHILAHYFYLLC